MKKYSLLILALVHLITYADDKITTCSFNEITQTEDLPLSSLMENCQLIHFENSDDASFSPWFTTVTDKYIGVRQHGNAPYKLFDSAGKFLCNVGSVGKGLEEYASSLYDDWIDDKNQLIYLAPRSGNKIHVYNTSGKFVKNIIAPQNLHKPKLHLSDDGKLTIVHMAFPNEEAIVIQFDKDGNVIKTQTPLPHLIVSNYDGEIFNSRNSSTFEFAHTSSDTLYHYSLAKNKIEPLFLLKFDSSEKPFMQYLKLKDYYLINVFEKGQIVAFNTKKDKASFAKIKNDFFGNLELPVNVATFRNGRFVYNLEQGQLISEIEKQLKEGKPSSKDKKKLTQLLNSLDKSANNVLFVGKLK